MNLSPLANGGGGEFSLSVVRVGRNMFLGQDRGARGCFKLYMFDGAERLKKLTTNVSGVMAGVLRSRASAAGLSRSCNSARRSDSRVYIVPMQRVGRSLSRCAAKTEDFPVRRFCL